MGDFSPNGAFLDENFDTRTKYSNNFPTTQNLGGQLPPATTPLHHAANLCIDWRVSMV